MKVVLKVRMMMLLNRTGMAYCTLNKSIVTLRNIPDWFGECPPRPAAAW